MRILLTTLLGVLGAAVQLRAQTPPADTLPTHTMNELLILGQKPTISRLPDIQGTYLWAGKKNEVIDVQGMDANIAEKTPRQLFAKVPGVFVYDMDGTGNQLNIATRGLDPHRGWEFNIRKDGVMTNTDIYGYPASHFTVPMEAIERIELVRGTGALQYGAQFGGMLNYVMKSADTTRAISLETTNSVGTYGLLSTYNALSGKVGKLEYYAYYSKRVSEGYRQNSLSNFDGQAVMLKYHVLSTLSVRAELAHARYLHQLPGQLTDAQFRADPRTSTRSRNYYSPDMYLPSLTLDWQLSDRTRLSWVTSAVLGSRNSVLFDRPADVVDAIDPTTLKYANRQVDIDRYHSYTSELRLLHTYSLGGGRLSTLVAGSRYIQNDLHRQQQGQGTSGSDYDLSITGTFGRDMHLKSKNVALFVENKFQLTDRFSLTPGARLELGESHLTGVVSYYPSEELANRIEHRFPLLGLNLSYTLKAAQNLYGGISQAYRPVIFKDIVPASLYEKVDKNLKDAYGYNAEIGYRGMSGPFRWDVSLFRLQYNNRLGNLATTSNNGTFYVYRTNIGNSLTDGAELFAEYVTRIRKTFLTVFSSTSYMDARYQNAQVRVGEVNQSIDGNKVESVPAWISRSGVTLRQGIWSVSMLYSYTAQSYADALNTEVPSANGAVGLVPAYGLLDLNATLRLQSNVLLRVNVNNLTNKQYFTKRPTFYPGPGIWPSDGRTAAVTLSVRL